MRKLNSVFLNLVVIAILLIFYFCLLFGGWISDSLGTRRDYVPVKVEVKVEVKEKLPRINWTWGRG